MKVNQFVFFLCLMALSIAGLSAHAQVDGRPSPEARMSSSASSYKVNPVNRILDQDLNSRKQIYASLERKTILKIDLKGVASENIESKMKEEIAKQNIIPDQLEIAIANARTEHDENMVIEYLRREAADRKENLEREDEKRRREAGGLPAVGATSPSSKAERVDTRGRFSITSGLGKGGRFTLKYSKKF